MILFKVLISFSFFCFLDAKKDEPKDSFVNEPVELAPVFHKPNAYEERSYDFWYENWPQPHVHGDQPKFDERHQHFKGYGDNYDFSNFITDPPKQNGIKSENVGEVKKDYGAEPEDKIAVEKLTKPVGNGESIPGYPDEKSPNRNPIGEEKHVYSDETSSKSNGADYTGPSSNPVPPPSSAATNPSPASYPGDSEVGGGTKDDYFKSPPGAQPELFPEVKLNPDNPYAPVSTSPPQPESKPAEGFSETNYGGGNGGQAPVTLSPTPVEPETSVDSGPRPCCPCCKEAETSGFTNRNNGGGDYSGGGGGGCGGPVVSEAQAPVFDNCPPPPIVGSPPNCCPQAPLPCCPRLPNCCIPQLPCCPRIQIPCCPPIQVCCQPLVPTCNSGCRSRAVTRVRTKRLGCVPCIGRKKREIFDEIIHIRQKRLGCIPCLHREKRHAPQQPGCQKCNTFQQHIVRRVKRTFSCSSCATHHERVKRQTQIANFYRGNQLGTHRNCEQCLDPPAFRGPVMKRSAGFENAQNEFLSRVKRASDGYDPLFKCDSSCCDYSKCIRSKPLKESTYKVPSNEEFVSDGNSADYDLSHTKELNLKASDIDSLVPNDESTSSKNGN